MYLAARPETQCSVREISDYFGISRHHLVKVAHRLSQLGYVTSSKGKGGGIRLAFDPREMKIGDLVRQLELNMQLVECFDRETNTCKIVVDCQLRHCLKEAGEAFLGALNRYTLHDVVQNKALLFAK